MKINVDNGKYTFSTDRSPGFEIEIRRHGEPWRIIDTGYNALSTLMAELDAARVVLKAARDVEALGECPASIRDALRTHEALVCDLEPPSEWTR